MKKFFAIMTLAAFTMGLAVAQTAPANKPADKSTTEKKTSKDKKKKKTTAATAPATK